MGKEVDTGWRLSTANRKNVMSGWAISASQRSSVAIGEIFFVFSIAFHMARNSTRTHCLGHLASFEGEGL